MKTGQSGSGMQSMHSIARRAGWIPVQLALQLAGTADARDDGKRSATARAAVVSGIPDGNHGDNSLPTVPGHRS